jgi:subtilisin family serine protease
MIRKLRSNHVPGELLVRLKPESQVQPRASSDSPFDSVGKVAARYSLGGQPLLADTFSSSEILHLKLHDQSQEAMDKAIHDLHADGRVAYAVTNDIVETFDGQGPPHQEPPPPPPPASSHERSVVPNDLHQELYGMGRISAPKGWADTSGDRNRAPLIAIIDSGTDYTHPDLAANIWVNPNEVANGKDDDGNGVIDDIHGYNAPGKNGDPSDSGTHGTHVAGTVGAVGNNGIGVTGVAWEANLMPCRFISGGMGTMADAIAALTYADAQGARITQNSWGGGNPNQALVDALEASPALHICAAGNDGNNSDIKPLFPAAYPLDNILSVAATDHNDKMAYFSNFGQMSVDLAAPGVRTYSTIPGGGYGLKSGTSMATPHVSGAASLVLTKFPDLSNQQLKDRLMFSTDRLEQLEGRVASGGRLNLASALENDRVAPGAVSELKAKNVTAKSIGIQWKASGDDGQVGKAAAYEIAYSDKPFGPEDFKKKAQVYTAAPKAPGSLEQARFDLTPSAQNRNIFVAVRSVDNVGNRSLMETLEVAVPAAHVAFEDAPSNWTTEGDWGREIVEGRGEVWSDSPGGFYKRDQKASLTSKSFSLQDFKTAQLQFDCRHDLEINFDKIFLEARSGGAEAEWAELDNFNLLDGWHTESFDLADYIGKDDVQLRFRLKTDGDVFKDGFQFDRLVVTGEPRE